jgi:ABC-type multidrug transport system fused ATPase/permease subunit
MRRSSQNSCKRYKTHFTQNNKHQLADLSRLLAKPSLDSDDKEELKQIAKRLNRNLKNISLRNRNDISYAKQRKEADVISQKIRSRVSQTESDIKKIEVNWFHRNPKKTIGIAAGAVACASVAASAFLTSSAMFGTTCTLTFASSLAIAGFCTGIGAAILLVGGFTALLLYHVLSKPEKLKTSLEESQKLCEELQKFLNEINALEDKYKRIPSIEETSEYYIELIMDCLNETQLESNRGLAKDLEKQNQDLFDTFEKIEFFCNEFSTKY